MKIGYDFLQCIAPVRSVMTGHTISVVIHCKWQTCDIQQLLIFCIHAYGFIMFIYHTEIVAQLHHEKTYLQ